MLASLLLLLFSATNDPAALGNYKLVGVTVDEAASTCKKCIAPPWLEDALCLSLDPEKKLVLGCSRVKKAVETTPRGYVVDRGLLVGSGTPARCVPPQPGACCKEEAAQWLMLFNVKDNLLKGATTGTTGTVCGKSFTPDCDCVFNYQAARTHD